MKYIVPFNEFYKYFGVGTNRGFFVCLFVFVCGGGLGIVDNCA